MPLPDAPREEPNATPVLAQIAPDPIPSEVVQEPVPIATLHEPPAVENLGPVGEVAVAVEVLGANPADPAGEDVANQEPAPHAPEAGKRVNVEPVLETVPVVEPLEAPAAAAPNPLPVPPSRLERLARVLDVTPPGVIDEARDGLHHLLSPDILLPGAFVRALVYLRVLRRKQAITENEFIEIDELLQNLPKWLNERVAATAQARQAQAHYQGLAKQMDSTSDFLGDRATLVRDLRLVQNHLQSQVQVLQAQLTAVTARLEHEEPLLEQPLAAFELLSQNLAQAREAVRQAERAAADASFRLDEYLLHLTHAGRKL
ncbi:uncharacterized protein LOC121051325 [Rosa chinensis]|uniref:uncharacterized protein LOC121051325 n=1 Tax=Rosa chinensis TaxID=74649 RepID=UPI001AD8E26C|nr:uncharacterized protein LOC121051325 [Rosa chinensis]